MWAGGYYYYCCGQLQVALNIIKILTVHYAIVEQR